MGAQSGGAMDPERIPVIVGVGQFNDRPENPDDGLDSVGLMVEALRLAEADAGEDWLADIDSLSIVEQISFPNLTDLHDVVAARIGASPTHRETSPLPHGDTPIRFLNEAANRIGAGETRIAAIVGGEGLRTAAHLQRKAAAAGAPPPDILRNNPKRKVSEYRRRFSLAAPVDAYPLYENAGRAAYGQSLEEGQAESAAIWSRMASVAQSNPGAWIRTGASEDSITEETANNRRISFPFLKFMVANSSVNQGAGFIVTSLAEARRRSVPEERIIHVGHGAGAHEPYDPLERDRYDHSPSLEAAIRNAMDFNGLTTADLDAVELYSCFPCVPKMARRVLGWPVDKPVTVHGGLTFGGGPVANYMSHAVVCMVQRLRDTHGTGLLYGNGGIVTSNHAIALSGKPFANAAFPKSSDVQAEADAARGPVPPLAEEYVGPVEIESYTVHYARDASVRSGIVMCRTPDGARTLAHVLASDVEGIAFLSGGGEEPIGTRGEVVAAGDDRVFRRVG